MDRAKSKKIRNIRVIATNIFMSLSVVAIVFVLMLVAMGFTFNEEGKLEQAGLIQLASFPSDANVEIDGDAQFNHTEFSKMLSSGSHKVKVTKNGYDTWQNDLKIDAGLLTRADWIRLFPKKAHISNTKSFDDLRFASFSPNRKQLIAIEHGKNSLLVIDIQNDKLKTDQLNLNECFSTTADKVILGNFSIVAWNENNNRLIAKWIIGDDETKATWHLVDLEHPENSINISKKFNLNFDSILIENDSASKLWSVENGNLRIIDLDKSTVSGVIASNIEKIAHNRSTIAFVSTDDNKTRHLNIYKEGEEGYSTIADLGKAKANSVIKLTMGTYWNEEWLAYSINKHIRIVSGKYPSYGKDRNNTSLKEKYSDKLSYVPQLLSTNDNQRIALFSGNNAITSYDIETKDRYDSKLSTALDNINWLDDYLIWQNENNSITVRDFDGGNVRTIIKKANAPFPVTISADNHWLYFFYEETNTDTKNNVSDQNTTTSVKYILKRENLQ